MKRHIFFIGLLMISFTILSGCDGVETKTTVKIDPIQCQGNPWEQEWLESGKQLSGTGDDILLKEYFDKRNMNLYSLRKEKTADFTCSACDCPTGYTLYLEVDKKDIKKLEELGFKKINMTN